MMPGPTRMDLECEQSPEDIRQVRAPQTLYDSDPATPPHDSDPATPPHDSDPATPPADPGAAHRISCQSAKALMGTAAADSRHERPGDGLSPGVAQRTRSPRSRRKNAPAAPPMPGGSGSVERPRANCAGRAPPSGRAAAKEGGTAGQP